MVNLRFLNQRLTAREVLSWAVTALAGATLGLALARLLFEAAPLRFRALAGPLPSLGVGLAGAALLVGLAWLARAKSDADPAPAMLPLLLGWIYVVAAPTDVNVLRGVVLIAGGLALAAALYVERRPTPTLPRARGRVREGMKIVADGVIALAAYFVTLGRSVGQADTFEFQVTAPVLGVAHPTGYPLYVLIGKLFSLIPLGGMAMRVNLTSALAAAISAGLVTLILGRRLGAAGLVAALGGLAFAFSPALWSQAVVAEVYALNAAFVAGLLWVGLGLLHGENHPRNLALGGLLLGLSLSHHLTTVLLLPALALAVLIARPRIGWRGWALAGGLLIAGLLVYAYIPLRWPALNDGRAMSAAEFIAWVTGRRYGGALQLRAWLSDPERWRIVGRLILDQYGPPGAVLGLAGLIALAVRNWRAAAVTVTAYAAYAFYGLNYIVPDIGVFLIPMHLIQAVWMAYAVATLLWWAGRHLPGGRAAWLDGAALTGLALIPLAALWTVGPGVDQRGKAQAEAWGRYVLSLPLDEDSAILADSDKIAPLEYLHRVEGLRPDMDMVVLGLESEYLDELGARLGAGQTVYLARFLPGLEGAYHLRSMGPLVEVGTGPYAGPTPDHDLNVPFTNGALELVGYDLDESHSSSGEPLRLTLYWRANRPVESNLQPRLALVDEGGEIAWQSEGAHPVDGRYPTTAWKPVETVPDYHEIQPPATLPPGAYMLQVGLTPPFSDDLLPTDDGRTWIALAAVNLPPSDSPPRLDRPLRVLAGGWWLHGVSAPETVPAGGAGATLEAAWERFGAGESPSVEAIEQPSGQAQPAEPSPTTAVSPGQMQLVACHAPARPGQERLEWFVRGADLTCGWLSVGREVCLLATTRIEGQAAPQAIANFDNQLLLVDIAFQEGQIAPGGVVGVTLTWQSLQAMDEDYTVFVHLLGPDGRLHGQVDAWPVQGTYPTSAWSPGERVVDAYAVTLDPDAPPGAYQVEVGVYLLRTNTRLPVVDAKGRPIDDKVLAGGLSVPNARPTS
jgi:hypothetical protein